MLICGLPGAGKTTLARRIEAAAPAVRLCPDDWMDALAIDLWDGEARSRIESLQWEIGQKLLAAGNTVIIEWGTWARAGRDALLAAARGRGAGAELHYLSAPVDALYARIRARGRENPPIEKEMMVRWAAAFGAPTAEEAARYDPPVYGA